MVDELIAGLQESADTLRELRECSRQRDELLVLLDDMVHIFIGSFEGEEFRHAAEGFPAVQAAQAAIARARSGQAGQDGEGQERNR